MEMPTGRPRGLLNVALPSVPVLRLGLALQIALLAIPRPASAETTGPAGTVGAPEARSIEYRYRDAHSHAISVLRGAPIALEAYPAGPGDAVRAWLEEHASDFGLEPGRDQLRVAAVEQGFHGSTRVRVQQLRDGLAVEGGDAMVVLDASGRLRSVISGFVPGLGAPMS